MQFLKQSTAATIKLGPFVDDADGKTAETGLTIQKADVRLSKNGGDMAAASADQGASNAGAPHDELGYYDIALDTTDTATVGTLKVMVTESGALPVWAEFQVVEEAIFDALFASSATGLLPANVTQWSGTNVATPATAGHPVVTLKVGTGTGEVNVSGGKAPATIAAGDLSSSDVQTAVETALATYNAVATTDLPTNFGSLAINASGHVSRVTLVDTTTTNTDMRGTDSAATASSLSTVAGKVDDILEDTGTTIPGTITTIDGIVDDIKAVTEKLDDTLEDNSGTYRFTEASLVEAPSGGGGGGDDAATIYTYFTSSDREDAFKADVGAALTTYGVAKAGDEMDIVDAPNATALSAMAAATEAAILNEGDATALLAAIATKVEEFIINDGDAAATLAAIATAVKGQLNDLSSGDVSSAVASALATYEAATTGDLEDIQAAAEIVQELTEDDGEGALRFTEKAVEMVDTEQAVIFPPVAGIVPDRTIGSASLSLYIGETGNFTIQVFDSMSQPIDLTEFEDDLVLTIEQSNKTDVQVVDYDGMTISGEDNNILTFTPSSSVTNTEQSLNWSLRVESTLQVLLTGTVRVSYAPIEDTP